MRHLHSGVPFAGRSGGFRASADDPGPATINDICLLITCHSNKIRSDGYGGERPSVLMMGNDAICKDLL